MSKIMESLLGREIEAILEDGTKPINYRWVAEIHVGDETYETMKVLNVDFKEEPELDFAPTVSIRIAMGAGTYVRHILPNDDDIEITLFRYHVIEGIDQIDFSRPAIVERYTATQFNKNDDITPGNQMDEISEKVLNITDFVEVDFQLINKAIEQLRLLTIGGSYRQTSPEELLKTVLTVSFEQLDVDEERIPIGVDMVPASNGESQEQVLIPHGTRVVDLPDYLQNMISGVYNSGMGSFIKDEYWYIYPKYDTKRFGETDRTMTIIRVPPNVMPGTERTYRESGGSLTVLATAEAAKFNMSEIKQLNDGNGTMFAEARNFLEEFTQTEDNRALARRGARMNEFVGREHPNGLNIAFMSNQSITANPYRQYSEIAQRQGNMFTFVWENSNMELVIPGMLVRVYTYEDDEIIEYRGILLGTYHAVQIRGQGSISKTYITRTVLNVFIDTQVQQGQ